MDGLISFSDFHKVDIRTGTIIEAKAFPEARKPAYQLFIDFGPDLGMKKTSAQITDHYTLEDLPGKQIVAVVNFPPKQIGKFMSEVLVLGAVEQDGKVVLLEPNQGTSNGIRIS